MDKYCKIYVSGFSSENFLISELASKLNVSCNGNEIISDCFEIYADFNEDYNMYEEKIFPDGFVYFKNILEIDFNASTEIEFCIIMINEILKFFWENDKPAIAACDYEDLTINHH